MNESIITEDTITPPKRRGPNKKRRVVRAKSEPQPKAAPVKDGEFAGISATSCCSACTVERCVISTVDICKHPYKTADSGCGPITMKNRLKARKLLKHQVIELAGG
jgi:hypothetical protein